jgi:hypothetical protein
MTDAGGIEVALVVQANGGDGLGESAVFLCGDDRCADREELDYV